MIGRLNHVAIAVPDLKAAAAAYETLLGASVSAPEELAAHGVRIAFVALPNTKVELMEPLGPDSPLAGFLQKNPKGGLHHICYEVADIVAAQGALLAAGARLLGGGPSIGAHGRPVLFLHPAEIGGTLIELEEVADGPVLAQTGPGHPRGPSP